MKIKDSHPAEQLLDQILHGDPFARFLLVRKIGPWKLAFFTVIYGLFYVIALPVIFNNFSTALKDWPTFVIVLIASPLILAYYLLEPSAIQTLFYSLLRQVKKINQDSEEKIPLTDLFGRSYWFWIAILLGLLQSIYIYYDTMYNRSGWQSVHPVMPLVLIPLRFLAFYAIIFIIARQIITIRALNKFLDLYPVDTLVLPLGRPSGLYVLAPYALSTGMIIGVVGLVLGMTILNISYGVERLTFEFLIDIAIYVIAAPVLFLLPLWKAHKLMSEAKKDLLNELEIETKEQYAISLKNLRKDNLTASDADRLEALEELYELTRKIPTWPLNFQTISRYGAAVTLPLIVPIILDIFTNLVASLLLMF